MRAACVRALTIIRSHFTIRGIVFHMTSSVSEKRVRGQSVEEVLAMLSLFPVNRRDWLHLSFFKDAAHVRFIAPA